MSGKVLPRVCLLLGPGTLHSRGAGRMDFLRYRLSGHQRLTGAELLAAIPEIAEHAQVEVDPQNPHEVATLEDLRRLSGRATALLGRADVDGLVLVQGTNALEETAYFLNLTVRSEKPIVVVGAQRPITAMSSDAELNLFDAIRVAACRESRGKGVVVATNGEINAAREVTKTNTYRVQTFRSRDMGLLGYVDADRIVYYRVPLRRHTAGSEFDLSAVTQMPYVEVLYVHDGGHPGLVKAALDLGAQGLVVAGSGAGGLGNLETEIYGLAEARSTVIVQASRVGEGRVVLHNNWYREGMVVADTLSPHKAALLLSLALTRSHDLAAIQRIFDEY
jgi:L-asparaginase type II